MAARQLWRSLRTLVAIVVNALALATFQLAAHRLGFLDMRAHRAARWKVLPVMWFLGCLLPSMTSLYRLRVAVVIRNRGGRGRALGLAGAARRPLYISAVLAFTPLAIFGALFLYLPLLPTEGSDGLHLDWRLPSTT